jgi:PAS domain S-box-containing protein
VTNGILDNNFLSALMNDMAEGVVVADERGIVVSFNRAAECLFGYDNAEIIGQNIAVLAPIKNRVDLKTFFEEFAAGPLTHMPMDGRPEIRGCRKDGSDFLVKASVSKVSHQGRQFFIATVMDQTGEERLLKAERSLANAQRIAHLGNWDWDIVSGEVSWSDEGIRIGGWSPQDLPPTSEQGLQAVHPDDIDRVRLTLRAAIFDKADFGFVHRIIRPDGELRTVRQEGQVEFDDDDTPIRVTGTVQDITVQTEIEAQLQETQRLESLGRLTSGIAHDFNNLLLVILGNLELLGYEVANTPSSLSLVDEAAKAGKRGAELTERLLAFSRQKDLAHEVVDVNGLLNGMDTMIRRTLGSGISLKFATDDDLWEIESDPGQLETTLSNLTNNASDAMPDGGELIIEARNVTLDEDSASRHPDAKLGQYVLISVTDSGSGVTPEIKARMFDPFFTTKEPGRGSGLGLSTVYGFIRQSGGYIHVDSEIKTGTTVELYLPRMTMTAGEAPQPEGNVGEPQGSGERILVVDDDLGVLGVTTAFLERLGYVVLPATGADQAIDTLESNSDVALLLTDLVLSAGQDGVQLGHIVQDRWPRMGILYMSGFTKDSMMYRSLLGQDMTLLEKPFDKQTIAHAVRLAIQNEPGVDPA